MSGSENFTCGLEGFISGFCTVSCQVSVRLHLGLCALSIGPYGFNEGFRVSLRCLWGYMRSFT